MEEQNHPQHQTDRNLIDGLMSRQSPGESDYVELSRLLIRYEGFPGALDLKEDMEKILVFWGITREELNLKSREIWAKGYRPGRDLDGEVGSAFDTSDKENP